MPLAAVVGSNIFCAHGGLSPQLHHLSQLHSIKRPIKTIPEEGVVCDLLWSDPEPIIQGWQENEDRGVSYVFGADVVEEFIQQHDLDLVCRAHQVVEDGYQFFCNR